MKTIWKMAGAACVMGLLLVAEPSEARAAQFGPEVTNTSTYVVKIEAPEVEVHTAANTSSAKAGTVKRGQTYQVLSQAEAGWVKIQAEDAAGYIRVPGNASLVEKTSQKVDESVKKRRETVEYALQFVGGKYVYGGTDPNSGVDCSGFTRYVMAKAASISLPHSSGGQSSYGREVTVDQMRPGDLLFYSSGSRINHVAMYIGDGQIVHASTERTGIKTSPYNYRKPVKIVSLL